MKLFRHLFRLISILIGIVSCDLLSNLEGNKTDDTIKIISNIPNSNWDSIIAMSSDDALCLNLSGSEYSEMLAVIDNDFDIRMTFDRNRRPISLTLDGAEFYTEYRDDSFDLIYNLNSISGIETIPTKSQTKATGEEAFDFAVDVTKSEIFDKVVNKADDKIEETYGKTNLLGNFMKFIDLVNTLRELDEIDNALELVDYLESSNDIVKFIDLIKTKPNHKQGDYITYAIGLIASDSEVDGAIATLTLDGTIRGESKGKEFNFEYGLCYSSSNDIPVYSDGNTGKTYNGLLLNPIKISLPENFKTPSLEKGKYHYRGYFKDNDTGNIIYSNNVGEFEIEDERWIDLGLPSGILWAAYNVGATSPEEYGGYYAWGETEEKTEYTLHNYQYYNRDTDMYENIGLDISNTIYDAATVNWGDGARMPQVNELKELLTTCKWEKGNMNGVNGYYCIGLNEKSIFIPFACLKGASNEDVYGSDQYAYLRSSNVYHESVDGYGRGWWAYGLFISDYVTDVLDGIMDRMIGTSIRPVKDPESEDTK